MHVRRWSHAAWPMKLIPSWPWSQTLSQSQLRVPIVLRCLICDNNECRDVTSCTVYCVLCTVYCNVMPGDSRSDPVSDSDLTGKLGTLCIRVKIKSLCLCKFWITEYEANIIHRVTEYIRAILLAVWYMGWKILAALSFILLWQIGLGYICLYASVTQTWRGFVRGRQRQRYARIIEKQGINKNWPSSQEWWLRSVRVEIGGRGTRLR